MTSVPQILRAVYAACLIGATCVHLDLHFQLGVLLGDMAPLGYPLFTRLYWSALTILDPVAAVLLFVRPRAGILLAAAIIASNVAHNSWILVRFSESADWRYWCQLSFAIFLFMTCRIAWRGSKEIAAHA